MKRLVYTFVVLIAMITAVISLNSCESCSREIKSISSDFGGGLYRRAVLMDYNGDTIKVWEGKFDIEKGESSKLFFDINGKRVWIQGGIFVSEEL